MEEAQMNTMSIGIPEKTVNFLFSLPDNEKINLAKCLLESISHKAEQTAMADSPFAAISGAWKDGCSVEETVNDLRAHRTFNLPCLPI